MRRPPSSGADGPSALREPGPPRSPAEPGRGGPGGGRARREPVGWSAGAHPPSGGGDPDRQGRTGPRRRPALRRRPRECGGVKAITRTVVLDNEVVGALVDVAHHKHRRVLAAVEATAG